MSRLLLVLLFLAGCATETPAQPRPQPLLQAESEPEEREQAKPEAPKKLRLYAGTFTRGKSTSEGIYVLEFDAKSGKLSEPRLAAKASNPGFLAVHPNQKFLYAVGRPAGKAGRRTGSVHAFAIDAETGDLKELNHQESGGPGPCHVCLDSHGKVVVVANYSGGSVASYSIGTDGKLSKPGSVIKHEGASVHPKRQTRPHAHSINVDPGGKFALAADLGTDQVLVYKLDESKGTLTPHGATTVAPGSGPRHLAFHPDGTTAYVLNELARTVTVFTFDAESGAMTEVQSISSVPADVTDGNSAEVRCSPDGRFLYTSNRGHDSIASFAIAPKSRKLTLTGHVSAGGNWPRNFTLSPSGRWLLVANQHSNTVVVFRIDIDGETGVPAPTGQVVTIPAPVCLRFWRG